MRREVVFLPEVGSDFAEGFKYYETLSPARGGAHFEAAFRGVLRQIEAGVVTHQQVFEHYHRVILPKFPYILYYRLVDRRAVIVALLFARFDPKRIRDELTKRQP